jgi:hypothetical protein
LGIVTRLVVESDLVFRKLQRLRSKHRCNYWIVWHFDTLYPNLDSFSSVKLSCGFLLGKRRPGRIETLPRSLDSLMRAHGKLYRQLWDPCQEPEQRVLTLLRLMQLEVAWV